MHVKIVSKNKFRTNMKISFLLYFALNSGRGKPTFPHWYAYLKHSFDVSRIWFFKHQIQNKFLGFFKKLLYLYKIIILRFTV